MQYILDITRHLPSVVSGPLTEPCWHAVLFYCIRLLAVETNGFGGICRFCKFPVNMFTTLVIEGLLLGLHWMHHSATIASFLAVALASSPCAISLRSTKSWPLITFS